MSDFSNFETLESDSNESTIDALEVLRHPDSADAVENIFELRQSIDSVDEDVIRLLAKRFEFTKRVGEIKAQYGFAPYDSKREKEQIERLNKIAQDVGLETSIAQAYHEFVVSEAKKRHQRIADRSQYAH